MTLVHILNRLFLACPTSYFNFLSNFNFVWSNVAKLYCQSKLFGTREFCLNNFVCSGVFYGTSGHIAPNIHLEGLIIWRKTVNVRHADMKESGYCCVLVWMRTVRMLVRMWSVCHLFFLNPEPHVDLTKIHVRSTMKLSLVHFLCTLHSVSTAYYVLVGNNYILSLSYLGFLALFVLLQKMQACSVTFIFC